MPSTLRGRHERRRAARPVGGTGCPSRRTPASQPGGEQKAPSGSKPRARWCGGGIGKGWAGRFAVSCGLESSEGLARHLLLPFPRKHLEESRAVCEMAPFDGLKGDFDPETPAQRRCRACQRPLPVALAQTGGSCSFKIQRLNP